MNPSHGKTLRILAAALLGVSCAPRAAQSVPQTTSAELPAGRSDAWAHYDRAVALHKQQQTDRAVNEYRLAEAGFKDTERGKSLAIYGRARALDDAGRCDEARVAYGEYAALVQGSDANGAAMAREYAPLCRADKREAADTVTSNVSTAVVAHDYARALLLAEEARPRKGEAPRPWLDYNRGVALAELKKTDEAVQAFTNAEHAFPETEIYGRSVAIYGRARALDAAGRCLEARKAYNAYAAMVDDREAAEGARKVADRCAKGP